MRHIVKCIACPSECVSEWVDAFIHNPTTRQTKCMNTKNYSYSSFLPSFLPLLFQFMSHNKYVGVMQNVHIHTSYTYIA